jgi:hypothetical protein
MNVLYVSLPYNAATNDYDKYFPFPMDYLKLKKDGDELYDGNLEAYQKKKEEIYVISDKIINLINESDKEIFLIAGNYAPDGDKGEWFDYILERIKKDVKMSGPYTLNASKLKDISIKTGYKIEIIPYVSTEGVNIPDEMLQAYPHGDKLKAAIRLSTGCVRSCFFCPTVQIHNRRYKVHSIDDTIAQIKDYYNRGVRLIVFIDDNISVVQKKFKEFLNKLKQENLKGMHFISLEGFETYIFEDEEICKLLKETHWDNIKTGMENINEDFLKKVNKYYTDHQVVVKAMENIQKYNLDVTVYLLIGLDETVEVVMDNIRFISKYHLGVRVNILRPYENGLLDFNSFQRKMDMTTMKHLSSLAYAASWLGTNYKIDMFEEDAMQKTLTRANINLNVIDDTFVFTGKVYIGFKTSKLIKLLTYWLEEKNGKVKRIKETKEEIIYQLVKDVVTENVEDLFY